MEWNPLTFVSVVLVVSYVAYAWINRGNLQKRWQLVNDKSFDFTDEVLRLFNDKTKSMKIIINSPK